MTIPTPIVTTPLWYAAIPNFLYVFSVPVLLHIWWWRINNSPESSMWRARSKSPSLSFKCAGLWSAVKNGGVPGYELESWATQVWCPLLMKLLLFLGNPSRRARGVPALFRQVAARHSGYLCIPRIPRSDLILLFFSPRTDIIYLFSTRNELIRADSRWFSVRVYIGAGQVGAVQKKWCQCGWKSDVGASKEWCRCG